MPQLVGVLARTKPVPLIDPIVPPAARLQGSATPGYRRCYAEDCGHPSPGFISIAVSDAQGSARFYEEYLGAIRDTFDFGQGAAVNDLG